MKISLIGYGKMGKAIERIAIDNGDSIVFKSSSSNWFAEKSAVLEADVAIEFSHPAAAFTNISKCFELGIPVISGTTGWLNHFDEVKKQCLKHNGSFLYASNFSIGMNVFFEINHVLARLMNAHEDYQISMEEIHHTQKLDSPSGTAITLANGIIDKIDRKNNWVNEPTKEANAVPIISKRIDPAPGTHQIKYSSIIDDIEISHTAKSRDGFAKGALLAAKWVVNKKGIFTMKDVLGI